MFWSGRKVNEVQERCVCDSYRSVCRWHCVLWLKEEPTVWDVTRCQFKSKGSRAWTLTVFLWVYFPSVLKPTLGPGLKPHPKAQRKHAAPNLEELQTELTELRSQFQQMKTQHKYDTGSHPCISVWVTSRSFRWHVCVSSKEIKLLMNELDEEKKIRLTLQVWRRSLGWGRSVVGSVINNCLCTLCCSVVDGDPTFEKTHVQKTGILREERWRKVKVLQ